MRKVLVLLIVVAGVYAGTPGTDLGEVAHDAAAYLPPGPNGDRYVLYMTDELDMDLIESAIDIDPYYGRISADDFVLGDYYYFYIEKITYWVINYGSPSGFYMRFWEDTDGSGPGVEMESADATYTLTSTGEYMWGHLIYEMEAEMDYEICCGHYWGAPYFYSGFLYMLVRTNAYDYQCYYDYGSGGSGPWYSSQDMWGAAYDFFQVIEGSDTFWNVFACAVDPEDGDSGVPVDSDIVFVCGGLVGEGVEWIDTDTIVFTAEDQTRRSKDEALHTGSSSLSTHGNPRPAGEISGTLDIDDSDKSYVICTFTPDEDLPEDIITCTVDGCLADRWGHEMGDDFVWTFSTGNYGVEQRSWGAIKAEF